MCQGEPSDFTKGQVALRRHRIPGPSVSSIGFSYWENQRGLLRARKIIEATYQADCNGAETRQRVERIFEDLLGYDYIKHLSRERAVAGTGGTEHVDFAIQLEAGTEAQPVMLVELKRVGVDLVQKHLKQVCTYAIDCGCEWVLLTNARDWRLYHVEFGRPPETKLVERWNLLRDELQVLASKFDLISLKRVRKGGLDKLWKRTEVLQPRSLLKAILSEEALRDVRRVLKRDTGVTVAADDIVGALRKMLNESTARVLQDVQVTLPSAAEKTATRRPRKERVSVAVKDLLEANLLRTGSILFVEYKGTRYEAYIQAEGLIAFEGNTYKTPSAAGGAVTRKYDVHTPPGWSFWQVVDSSGEVKPLDALRQQLMAIRSSNSIGEEVSATHGDQEI